MSQIEVNSRDFNFIHPVVKALRQRAEEGSKPGKRNDPFRIAAVVEGGALRGVVSAAELLTLKELGMLDAFDVFYGESIGGPNIGWALSGCLERAINTYYQEINNGKFIHPGRFFLGRPIVDLDFLEKVVMEKYPPNFDVLKSSESKLNLLAARVDQIDKITSEKTPHHPLVMLNNFQDRDNFIEACHVAIQMPLFAGKPYSYQSMRLWDAGVVNKLPVEVAIEDGCTHILVLSCVASDYQPKNRSALYNLAGYAYIQRFNPLLAQGFLKVISKYRQTLTMLREKQVNTGQPPFIATIFLPAGFPTLHSFERRSEKLKEAEEAAKKSTRRLFGLN